MILFTDYATGKKSFTFTAAVIFALLAVGIVLLSVYKMVQGESLQNLELVFLFVGYLTTLFTGLYMNKRMRLSRDGVDIQNDS